MEEEEEPRDLRAHVPGASLEGGSDTIHPQILPLGALSEPGSPRARLRAPGRLADNAVQDNDIQEQEEKGSGFAPILAKRGGPGHAGTSRFKGVSQDKRTNRWQVMCKGKYLGYHTTEEAAARAYSMYHENGIDHVEHRDSSTSQFTGVSWHKERNQWRAQCKGMHLSLHTTERVAALAYNVEAERRGLPLNVIPPAGALGAGAAAGAGAGTGGGAGPKRAAPKNSASPLTSKKMKRAAPSTLAVSAPS